MYREYSDLPALWGEVAEYVVSKGIKVEDLLPYDGVSDHIHLSDLLVAIHRTSLVTQKATAAKDIYARVEEEAITEGNDSPEMLELFLQLVSDQIRLDRDDIVQG